MERLVALEYLAPRQGRRDSRFVYQLLMDLDATKQPAHVGLIDTPVLADGHHYKTNLAGQNGVVTGGDQTGPTPSVPLSDNDLERT